MKQCKLKMSDAEIDAIIKEVDFFGNGINYSDFLSATMDLQEALTDEKLWTLFKTFDTDNTDFITQDNLQEAFLRLGRNYSEDEFKKMMETHDITHDGRLSFDEFKEIFKDERSKVK